MGASVEPGGGRTGGSEAKAPHSATPLFPSDLRLQAPALRTLQHISPCCHTHSWPFLISGVNVRCTVVHVFNMCPVLDQRSPGDLATGSVHSRSRLPRASIELFPGLKVDHHPRELFPGEGFSRVQSAKQRKDPADSQSS